VTRVPYDGVSSSVSRGAERWDDAGDSPQYGATYTAPSALPSISFILVTVTALQSPETGTMRCRVVVAQERSFLLHSYSGSGVFLRRVCPLASLPFKADEMATSPAVSRT